MYQNTVVIIPSYKELRNLSILLNKLQHALPGIKIIVVDDSPGDENKKIQDMIAKMKNIIILSRMKKLGRGSAVITGFSKGLLYKDTEYFFEMDSDLAHDPADIEKFLQKMRETKCDLVIGSRYLPGGKVINMPWYRVFLSHIIKMFLSFWLGVTLTDYTSGFRLYNKAAVKYITTTTLQTTGFITLSETIYKLNHQGFTIKEIPIHVYGRNTGKSTVTIGLLLSSLISIIKIRLQPID